MIQVHVSAQTHSPPSVPSVSTRATAGAAAGTPVPDSTRDRKQPLVMRWQPVVPDGASDTGSLTASTQPQDGGPSREELLEAVQRLREQIDYTAPPEYSGPEI